MTPRVEWIKQIGQTPDRRPRASFILKVYPLATAHTIGNSSISAGTNDASSMDKADWSKQFPAIVHPQGNPLTIALTTGHS